MKLRRTLSGILFGVGCAMAFVGLLALILPAVANEQLHLVLASFSMPTQHAAIGCINACMSLALANGWLVLLAGVTLLTIGVALFAHFTPEEKPQPRDVYRRPAAMASEPLWEQLEPARNDPNPFAEAAMWEQFAPKIQPVPQKEAVKVGFGSPMLEPNRIEDEAVPDAPAVSAEVYERPAPRTFQEEEPTSETFMPVTEEPEEIVTQTDENTVEEAPVQSETSASGGKPVQLSPRIRSTVGKRREW